MRYLGIDYGTKRVGTALSDEGGRMAFPHATFTNDSTLLGALTHLIERKNVKKIIVGQSHNLSGAPNRLQADIEKFVDNLMKHIDIPVDYQQEQFTTAQAMRVQGKTSMTDASAAALILNSYLSRVNV